MDLFGSTQMVNILPYDGVARYFGPVLEQAAADHYLDRLLNAIAWQNDEALIFGKHITTKRKVAWYGDEDYPYTYSKTTKRALPWIPELLVLRQMVETATGASFNSCLLNLYHDGSEGVTWHSDDEKALKRHATIASLTLGAPRKFSFKHKRNKQTVSLLLEHGSLLTMEGATQRHWLHSLPKTVKVTRPRVNLTFRTMETVSP